MTWGIDHKEKVFHQYKFFCDFLELHCEKMTWDIGVLRVRAECPNIHPCRRRGAGSHSSKMPLSLADFRATLRVDSPREAHARVSVFTQYPTLRLELHAPSRA